MRSNLPVSQREFEFPSDATLMSTTDIEGRITYANAAFVAVSGFEASELVGQPHNLVRHPDMPPEAFADMWATLQSGQSWTAVVKNRRKNGDHYWVRANATPITRQGRTTGYLSVRTRPGREEVAAAEAAYAQFREGTSRLCFSKGLLLPRAATARLLQLNRTLSVRWRLALPVTGLSLFHVAIAAAAGVNGVALAALVGAVAAASALALWALNAQMARPLERLRDRAQRTANGEVDHWTLDRTDDIGMAQRAVNQLGLMLRWITADVSQQVVTFEQASREIAQGNDDLSARTEQSAASLQQTASSMEQMSATVRHNADTCLQAAELATLASQAAQQGSASVAKVDQAMQGISESSHRIADILGVIDGIAFQTNLLALNAAVEAARAGEQGRGFAVVAGEVRALAQRSASAAREIKTLIAESGERIDAGAHDVTQANSAMQGIVHQIARVTELINEISAATAEQSQGIGQVNQAISQLDQSTQHNAALVEQSAAAAQSLRHQAELLVAAISVFRAGAGAETRRPPGPLSPEPAQSQPTAAASPTPGVASAVPGPQL
ncbi:MAG TPA: methyl-accepting chemotaxis protein [Ideonella sp.]|uniref:methyl-accepting chemotaxis protein n=1 Tax=Ideonella sp. TaxID=1929293 RepID=UPI002E3158A4|nr:methyl-accepting chemotaxis protein [Ideonella sp.]HEX5685079.1 methyl-accepting chemotaxis protein [Ideonella sp.]